MTSRKNKILILQFFLLIAGVFFIFLTFVVFKDRLQKILFQIMTKEI